MADEENPGRDRKGRGYVQCISQGEILSNKLRFYADPSGRKATYVRTNWLRFHRRPYAGSPRSRASAIYAFLFCLLIPSALFAQPANQPAGTRNGETFEQLKEKLRQIEEQHHKELSDLKERLGMVEKQQSALSDEIGQHIKVGGYGAMRYEGFSGMQSTNEGTLELLISGHIHDRIRIYNEIDLGVPGQTASAEQSYVDLLLTQPFNVRAGVLLIPFGKFNLDHFDPRRDLSRPPLVNTVIIPTTWGDLGAGSFGLIQVSDNVKATYDVQVVNGLTDAFITATANTGLPNARNNLTSDNNGNKALVGRGTFKLFDQYEIGFSGYRGAYRPSGQDMITGMALDAEFKPRNVKVLENFVFRGEYAHFDVQGSTAPSRLWGYYGQLTYRFWFSSLNSSILGRHFNNPTFALVALVGYSQIDTTASPTGKLTGQQYIIGFNYRPVEDYVFKAEYQFNHGQLGQQSADGFITSIAWIF